MADAFICGGVRTPIGRYGGALAAVRPDDLLAHVLRTLVARAPQLDPAAITDVVTGCSNQAGEDGTNLARMGVLLAGLPDSVPGTTVNRLCGSGLDAVGTAARAIRAGEAQIMIAAGAESMSRAPLVMAKADRAFARAQAIFDTTIGWRFPNPGMAAYGRDGMPETAENVAEEHSIARADQDAFALRSHQRAVAASTARAAEITPIEARAPRGRGTIQVAEDEGPRADTTLDALAALPAPFRTNGTVTAGNASGLNDGAAALFIATEAAASTHGLTPRARVLGTATAGLPPRVMGLGPLPATEALCARLSLRIEDFDVIELNEAFAAQALAVTRAWGLPDDADHVNPRGGAIALGHPVGMTGVRLILSLLAELSSRGGKRGLATMCIGNGQGIAVAVEAL